MINELIKKKRQGITRIIMMTILGALNLSLLPQEQPVTQNPPIQKKMVLVKIDLKDIYCPMCLESFKAFCDNLSTQAHEISAVGILVFQKPKENEKSENYIKIIEKQLRGFISGNNIQFPIIIDRYHVFEKGNFGDWDIILLDTSRNLLKKYSFPISIEQFNEINSSEKGEY